MPLELTSDQLVALAAEVLDIESRAVDALRSRLDASFAAACELCMDTPGRIVVTGMGKSGHIGNKIAATLASTGTPSFFMHPGEASHGDLGMITGQDVLLAVSYSGETDEVLTILPLVKRMGAKMLSLTGKPNSTLARAADVHLDVSVSEEACPLNLAPTASTTAMLALGDALAMAVSRRRGFGVDDFQKVHPGGGLGRQLMPVVDAMRFHVDRGLPLVDQSVTVGQAIRADTPVPGVRRAGAVLVIDSQQKLAGILTDGDLRRLLIRLGDAALNQPIKDVMTVHPQRLTNRSLVRDAVQMVREFRIDEIPVVDGDDKPLGLIDVQDLVALKVIEE